MDTKNKIAAAIAEMEKDGDYIVHRKLKPVFCRYEGDNSKIRSAVYIDTETTGFNQETDRIIEVAMIPFKYNHETGAIVEMLESEAFSCFEDPGFPISAEITEITGISDSDVKGQKFDDERINRVANEADLVIAHNSKFDRPFMEKRFPVFVDKSWACSLTDINWESEGISSGKLEFIAYKFHFFYCAHRALNDCFAGVQILSEKLPKSGRFAMNALVESARKVEKKFKFVAPFALNDKIKELGGVWDGVKKMWHANIDIKKIDELKLRAAIAGVELVDLKEDITARNRFR